MVTFNIATTATPKATLIDIANRIRQRTALDGAFAAGTALASGCLACFLLQSKQEEENNNKNMAHGQQNTAATAKVDDEEVILWDFLNSQLLRPHPLLLQREETGLWLPSSLLLNPSLSRAFLDSTITASLLKVIPPSVLNFSRTLLEKEEEEAGSFSLRRRSRTIAQLELVAEKAATLESKYKVNWRRPLGEGTFGAVYAATHRTSGHRVAIKKISTRFTNNVSFQNEMGALLQIRAYGGHPNICGMQENFEETSASGDEGYYYLVLDLIAGGEMFDQLCNQGAYSEADAARLIREVASAMNFMHGIGITHGDMKPENLMLSSKESASAVVKVVDFGCAQMHGDVPILGHESGVVLTSAGRGAANTPAYCPPEVLKRNRHYRNRSSNNEQVDTRIDPSFDMWAVGVILYIMLTGVHPFDLYGNATDAEIEQAIVSGKKPPLGKSPLTAHLSTDAISVIQQLLQWNPRSRLTAQQLLEHPWVRGETARTSKIADSDKRLSAYRAFKTKLEAKAFRDMVSLSTNTANMDETVDGNNSGGVNGNGTGSTGGGADDTVGKRTSLIERCFQMFDPDHRGYIPAKELRKLAGDSHGTGDAVIGDDENLSLSGFSDILSEHMRNKYFPKGHMIYHEGEVGNAMYFLNSGSIEVYTKDGTRSVRTSGEFFGEGALLNPKKTRSASIRCLTPVHAIEISREYFEKYIASDEGVKLNLREKDKARKRQRAKTLLQLQQNMQEQAYAKGDFLFKKGGKDNELFLIEEGTVVLKAGDQDIIYVGKGEMVGEHSSVFGRPRNVHAVCASDECRVFILSARDFYKLLSSHPSFKESIRDICLRREFQKALCAKTRKSFPKNEKELRVAFDFVDKGKTGTIQLEEIRSLLMDFDPTYTKQDVLDILNALDLDESGSVNWAEFQRIFGMVENPTGSTTGAANNSRRRKKWKR